MRELLDSLAAAPDRPRTFPQIEDSIGWPRQESGRRDARRKWSSGDLWTLDGRA
jgi:hypothetical protein